MRNCFLYLAHFWDLIIGFRVGLHNKRFGHGTPNFGTRPANLRHGTPELCRVNAYLRARVPKDSGGPSTPEIGSLGPPVWSAVSTDIHYKGRVLAF